MSEANELRGEMTVTLEGVEYVMRPSYEAIVAFERQTAANLHILWMGAVSKTLAVENTAIIVTECLKAQGRALLERGDQTGASIAAFNSKAVGELLIDSGLPAVWGKLAEMLRAAIDGGYTAQGNRKPQAISPATPADA